MLSDLCAVQAAMCSCYARLVCVSMLDKNQLRMRELLSEHNQLDHPYCILLSHYANSCPVAVDIHSKKNK